MSSANYKPEERELGHLIHMIGRLQAIRADQFMDEIGLHRSQARLLLTLSEEDGITHSKIAEKLGISPAAATKVIKRMEELHFLQRQADASDERVSRVFLKPGGWAAIEQIRSVFWQVDHLLFRDISPDDIATLTRLVKQMDENLRSPRVGPLFEKVSL
jgi:DNA-binding MarR family transcriptional regulator